MEKSIAERLYENLKAGKTFTFRHHTLDRDLTFTKTDEYTWEMTNNHYVTVHNIPNADIYDFVMDALYNRQFTIIFEDEMFKGPPVFGFTFDDDWNLMMKIERRNVVNNGSES